MRKRERRKCPRKFVRYCRRCPKSRVSKRRKRRRRRRGQHRRESGRRKASPSSRKAGQGGCGLMKKRIRRRNRWHCRPALPKVKKTRFAAACPRKEPRGGKSPSLASSRTRSTSSCKRRRVMSTSPPRESIDQSINHRERRMRHDKSPTTTLKFEISEVRYF